MVLGAELAAGSVATAMRTHAWVVLEHQGRVVSYAYGVQRTIATGQDPPTEPR